MCRRSPEKFQTGTPVPIINLRLKEITMYKLMVTCPVVIVLATITFNVFYLIMALQMGRLSINSITWIIAQIPCIKPAMMGDLMPYMQVQQMLSK